MNVVFDLGGVVFDWQPDALVRRVFEDPTTQVLVRREIIDHPDWIELDRGTLSQDAAILRGASRTGMPHQAIASLFHEVPPSLTPIEATIDLLRELSNTSHSLFVLSNMHVASARFLEANHDIWNLFDGIVFSCRIKKVKPEPGIFEHLLREHRIQPTETVFVDDLRENLDAASAFGIRTIQFVSPAQCRADLERLDCL